MPHINIEVSDELLKAMKLRCAESGERQKDWVVARLTEAASGRPKSNAVAVEGDSGSAMAKPSRGARASRPTVLPAEVAQPLGDKRCKHGLPTCNVCGFKDGKKGK